MKSLLLVVMTVLIGTVGISQKANAGVPTYVGDYMVDGGGAGSAFQWQNNPLCYTPQEAAALLFGGLPTDYFISVDPNTVDPTTITHTGHEDGWAEPDTIFAENFKLQTGTGYNDPGGQGTAWSAYVYDHADQNINYVWAANGGNQGNPGAPCGCMTPEPSSCALLLTGGLPLFGLLRRK